MKSIIEQSNHLKMIRGYFSKLILYAIFLLALNGQYTFGNSETCELKNIASGKPYSLSREPNYALCSKDAERKQLTDGIHAKSNKSFWLQQETVGWTSRAPHITIDLGEEMPIGGASYSTAGGRAGVTFPRHIFVTTSMDGKNFYFAGDLVQMARGDVPDFNYTDGEKTFVYRTGNMKTRGRYVRFIPILGSGPYVFIDELEVYGGDKNFLNVPYKGQKFSGDEIPLDLMVNSCAKMRLEKDIATIKTKLEKSTVSAGEKTQFASMLDKLRQELTDTEMNFDAKTFRAVIPFNLLHQRIFGINAKILAAKGYRPLTVWSGYPYSRLEILDDPVQEKAALSVKMMQKEHRAAVFNITNSGDIPVKLRFRLSGIPDCVEVRQMEYVDTANLQISATALAPVTPVEGYYETTVHSGMTRQIWLTFYPGNSLSGTYSGEVTLQADDFEQSVPIELEINNFELQKSNLKVGVWDYAVNMLNGITPKNQQTVIRDMQQYLVNVAIGHRAQAAIPNPTDIDKNGHLIKPLNFSNFENWRKLWQNANHYQMFLAIRPSTRFAGLKPGTPEFNTAVQEWAAAWSDYLNRQNIPARNVQFHFLDEPRTPEDYITLKQWLEPFSKGNTMIEIYNDPVHLDKTQNHEAAMAALAYCDVICPMLRQYVKYDNKIVDFLTSQASKGKKLWFYSCDGPNRFYAPAYFRFQPWYCFKYGMEGSMIWVYSDYKDNWNEYTRISGLSYAMVFLSPYTTTPTKHWEAFREGIQDYAYMAMLREKLQTASVGQLKQIATVAGGSTDPDQIMSNIFNPVVQTQFFEKGMGNFEWTQTDQCKIAERMRLHMLDILKILQQ